MVLSPCVRAFDRRGWARERAVDLDVDLVDDLQRPEERRVGLDAPVGLADPRAAGQAAVAAGGQVERHRVARAREVEVALDAQRAAGRGRHAARAKPDRAAREDLLVDRLLDARLVLVAERLHSAGALAD